MIDHLLDDGALRWMLYMYRFCDPRSNPSGLPRWGNRLWEVKHLASAMQWVVEQEKPMAFEPEKKKIKILKRRCCLLWTFLCKVKQLEKRRKVTGA